MEGVEGAESMRQPRDFDLHFSPPPPPTSPKGGKKKKEREREGEELRLFRMDCNMGLLFGLGVFN